MLPKDKNSFIKIIILYCVLYVLIQVIVKPLWFVGLFSKFN